MSEWLPERHVPSNRLAFRVTQYFMDTLRHETLTYRDNILQSHRYTSCDPSTGILTETTHSPLSGTATHQSRYGRTLSATTADGTRYNYFDPYGRVFQSDRTVGDNPQKFYEMWLGYNDYGNVAERDLFHASGDNVIATFHVYDPFGQLIATTNALGEVEHATFDAQGQVTASSGTVYPVQHGYDTAGRHITLQTTRDGTAWDTTYWLYDSAFGLVTNKLYADNSTVSYTHTADGKLATRTWARGVTTAYSYDPAQNLTSISYWRTSVSADATPAITFAYDSLQRLQSAANGLAAYSYTHSHSGNLTNEVATINGTLQSIDRRFDEYQRLITLAVNGKRVDYSYTANQLNQYTSIGNGATIEPEYDQDGNMIWDGRFHYTYDVENRLISVYSNTTCVVSNAYDHQSRRVLKISHGDAETRSYLYDGWKLVQETIATTSSVTTNRYIWGKDLSGSLQGAGGVGGLVAVIQGRDGSPSCPFFSLYDNNGNVLAYIDDTGSIVAEYRYDAFGNTISQNGALANTFPHCFSTKYFDAETGLYYYGYRFYSPELMRWLNRDPIEEEGGQNIISYYSR